MRRSLQNALASTALTMLSLYLWRIAYISTDWAVLALIPLAFAIVAGLWPLVLKPWRARLHIALRPESSLGGFLTGRLRAIFISGAFTIVAVILLAWQALSVSIPEAAIILAAFFLSACLFATGQTLLLRHFQQPFARSIATSVVTWTVALPFTLIIALSTWALAPIPGKMLDAELMDALLIGLGNLPERGGWIAAILALPYGYEATKIWAVVQLRDYPIVGAVFSLDAALFSFVLCRSAIIITQFVETHIMKEPD